jgi:hypothetical protein
MEKSLFVQFVNKYFKIFGQKISERINGQELAQMYYHATALVPEFTPTLKWGSLSVNGTTVAADIVAMDSSLPLKKRDSIRKADGDIPKTGMKLYLNENTMNEIRTMQAMGVEESLIVQKLFGDLTKCATGVKERMEYLFLQAISSGIIEIPTDESPGLAVRADFGYPATNKFQATVAPWSETTADPCADIENVLERASSRGVALRYLWMDKQTWNLFKANEKVRQSYAFHVGFSGQNAPNVQSVEKANEWLLSAYGLTLVVVDRYVNVEKDGKQKSVKPWLDHSVVFTKSNVVGRLQWTTVVELAFPVKQVDYAVVDNYILLSKYSTNDPVREYSSSQAMAIPVIDDIDQIYILDSGTLVNDDAQTEGNTTFSYKDVSYTKASVITAINLAYNSTTKAKAGDTDAKLNKAINAMDDAQVAIFEANIVAS